MATKTATKDVDIEAGNNNGGGGALYPNMTEDPVLRWGFIRKVYAILSLQFLLTVGLAATVVLVRPIPRFILQTTPGFAVFILILILPLILLWPLHAFAKKHPVNLFLLALFTVSVSFAVGLSCSLSKGRIILEAGILTSVVVVSLTLYTFWAAKRGHDFMFLGPFLFTSLLVLLVFLLIQIFIPLGRLGLMIYSAIATIVFSGFIIYDTDNLIKRFNYDEYIPASVSLYLDVINLFLALLNLGNCAEN